MEMVGRGRGDFEKEKYVVAEGYRLKAGFLGCFCLLSVLALVLGIGFGNNWWIRHRAPPVNECSMLTAVATPAQKQICCSQGFRNFCAPPQRDLVRQVDQYYYHVKNIKENHLVPVPIPPPPRKVITQKVMVHTHAFDCDQSVDDWKHIWSTRQQRYCCYLRQIGCHTKVEYRPHYHTITKTEPVNVPVPVPVPAPPAQVITHVKNVPIHDAPQIVRVPTPGAPISVPRYVHQKHYVPVPEPSPPQYRNVPVPIPVKEPGKVIKVPTPLPPQTVVRNKVIYKTKHLRVQHIYDCAAGYSNWNSGWSSAKKSWCCAHEQKGCPGSHSGHLTKTVVTGVTQHEGPTYYHHLGTVPYHHIHHIHHYHTYHTHSYANYDNSDGLSTVIHSNSGDTLNGIGSGYTGSTSGSFGTGSFDTDTGSLSDASWHGGDLTNEDVMAPRRLQAIAAEALPSGASIAGHYVDGSDASIGQSHYIDGTGGATRVIHSSYADSADSGTASSYADGILHGGHYVDSASTGIHDGQYTDGSSSLSSLGDLVHEGHYGSSSGQILHDGWSTIHPEEHVHHVHVTHYTVPAPVPQPVEPQTHVHEVVRRHYGTVYRKVPVNHYVHVKMPQQPPIVHTVKVMAPAKTYSCNGVGDQPDPSWSDKHTRWCCYKYGTFCPKTVIDKNIYHTVVKKQPVKVPVPEPMPTHPPIVKTIHHTYHVPSPPRYVHVPVPGPTVVKNVVVPENVPVPVPEPPQVINVKKPYTVHVPGKNHYVHVPVPSPPHIVTKYHTHWNTVVDHGDTATYDCHAGFSDWHSLWSHAKQRWCCSNKFVGCPGSWHGAIAHTTHVTHVHHIHHYHSGSYPGGWHSHSWSSSDGYHPLKK